MSLIFKPSIREHSSAVGAVCQWLENPYALVSWWEMEKFSAAAFMFISRSLADLRIALAKLQPDQMLWRHGDGGGVDALVSAIGERCEELSLRTSQRCVADVLRDIERGATASALSTTLVELDNTIRREMSTNLFFHMPWEQANSYDQKELFGAEVNAKFPSIQFDTVEAGNCYAMGRGTACVFHLMRIMEVGVQRFGAKLGVVLVQEKNWQVILNETDKAIRKLDPKDPATIGKCQASAMLYAVKVAWRNEVMHPNDKYTLEEAKDLIGQVKLFMIQLASII